MSKKAKKIDIKLINKLREETGAPVIRVKKLLDELEGNETEALEILKKEGFEKAAKRSERETSQGIVATYIHHNQKLATMVELLCETDFVSRNDLFIQLGKNLAMQLAFSEPKNVAEFEKQEFIKDPSKTVLDLVKELIAKTGENVRIGKFYRLEIGK
ncbi:elongation factor Ts [Candidatus Woesebacteria bacterium]|nr:elongation factor Ts [Candidatus Woesebacteria bacterium]QQG47393.1 MAG: elongation factor Ts [Candidatus Woesebacteria bacterium]